MNDFLLDRTFSAFPKRDLTWLEDWREFFRCCDLLPDIYQDVPEQFNCLSRIIILMIVFLMLFYGFNMYVVALFVVLVVIIILYLVLYKKKSFCPMKENFEPKPKTSNIPLNRTPIYGCQKQGNCFYQTDMILYDSKNPNEDITISGMNNNPTLIDTQQSGTWCMSDLPLGMETASINQSLVGPANIKTKAIPVIPPPICDPTIWNPNDFVVPSWINDQRRIEMSQNGYMTWDNEQEQACSRTTQKDLYGKYACVEPPKREVREDFSTYGSSEYDLPAPNKYVNSTYSNAVQDEVMDTSFGYYPQNAKYNYPVNSPPNECTPALSDYNKNLYSIPLQPNVYTRSQVNQPDASMSNMGISFTQPHLPYACQMDDRGNMMIDEFDPNQYPSEYLLRGRDEYARDMVPRHEIYDPRLTGYGTSYRSYQDPVTGQTRFYYDDIDAHTQYNYITRNKIDFTNFGPTTGPYRGNPDNTRPLADELYHNDQMKQRTELQYRLMAKNSHREWQRRSAPLNTNNYSRAGCGAQGSSTYAGPRGGY